MSMKIRGYGLVVFVTFTMTVSAASPPPLDLKVHATERVEGSYVRKLISYSVEPDERAWAYLGVPMQLDGPVPAVLEKERLEDKQ